MRISRLGIIGILLVLILFFLYRETNILIVSTINLSFDNLPPGFEGFKIVHIADLHNKEFGKGQGKLVRAIEQSNPDIIAITGDLIDIDNEKDENAIALIEGIKDVAPIYYVTGNHEWRSGRYPALREELEKLGVNILDKKARQITLGKEYITMIGIDDPLKYSSWEYGQGFTQQLSSLTDSINEGDFTILLSHRPELFEEYVSQKISLVLSGHTHGGQIGLPGKRAIVVPHQGLFPKYSKGLYEQNDTKMIISRGLGTSHIPIRLFSRPEMIVITLSSK